MVLFDRVRDTVEIGRMPLGIKVLASIPRTSERCGEGQRDLPVTFAGVRFVPGDHIYM